MDCNRSNLNPTALLDLKAELQKKYEAFKQAKFLQRPLQKRTPLKKGECSKIEKKKLHLSQSEPLNDEETKALQKSRQALEAKAKLYEKITSNKILIDDEENDKYLVDFQRKVLYSPMNFENDKHTKVAVTTQEFESTSSSEKISGTCNKTEDESLDPDQPVHYQNVQYDEIREHGTSYFAFSTDEKKRKEQMADLNAARHETELQRLAKQKVSKKRKEILEARLKKICERRNIDTNVVNSYTSLGAPEEETEITIPETDLSSIPLPKTPEVNEEKETKVRPWDIGKPGVNFHPAKKKIKSQSDWVEERRNERSSEFAPPTVYSKKYA